MAEFKLGRLRFVWQGEWTTGTAYVKDDIISYGGTSYVCVSAHTANADFYVDRDASRWEVMTAGIQYKSAEWSTGIVYAENDIVRYGGRVYICLDGHTSGEDFFNDKDSNKWNLFVDGVQWKVDPWTASGTLYKEGDLVRHGGRVYICVDGHTSSPLFETDFNAGDWQLFADGTQWVNIWSADTLYKVGDIVRVSGKAYICINEHTSNAESRGGFYSDLPYWNLYVDGNSFRSAWDTTSYYWVGDVVRYGAKSYVCLVGHEASADFYTDVDAPNNRWALMNDGQQWLNAWAGGTLYKEGDLVRHGGRVYVCANGHTSTVDVDNAAAGFTTDVANWHVFSDGIAWKNVWATGTYYKLNDIIRYGAKAYICVSEHEASADFYTDVDAPNNRWELLVDGQEWKTNPWSVGTLYKEGDLVRYGGRVYICVDGHTSTSDANRFDTDFDAGKWQLFADGTQWKADPWTAGTYYKTGDVVKYGGKTYVAIDDHEANATQDGGFYIDLAGDPNALPDPILPKWDLYADGTEWKGDWSLETYYKLGDIVRYDGNVYICIEGHTSATTIEQGLELDIAKWDVYSEGFKYKGIWANTTKYNVNDVVKFGGSLYICVSYHTSSTTFQEAYWNILIGGLEFEDTWNANVEYQIGDIVTYGGYSYVAQARNTGNIPPGFPDDWDLLTTGFKVVGEWSPTQSYSVGEVVNYGGSTYVAIVEAEAGQAPRTVLGAVSPLWSIVAAGFNWRNEWLPDTKYRVGDTIRWVANSYICVLDHTSSADSANQPDNDTEAVYWNSIAEGAEGNVLARRGDIVTRNAVRNVRLPRGLPGQVLQVQDRDVVWDYFNIVDNVYYVTIDGIDASDQGTTLQTPFRTVKYATEYIQADLANRAPATIYVKTGLYREELPISVPANVAIVGDELRSTRISPAVGKGVESVTVTSAGAGYTTVPTVTFSAPTIANGVTAEGYAVLGTGGNSGKVVEIIVTKAGSGYSSAPIVTIDGDGSTTATATATLKAKPYSQTNMFYLRDATGLRNMTFQGLDVTLGQPNQYLTKRPSVECNYVSLDPGTGPGDESVWITTRSPYVQNVTTYGNGAVGMKIDGAIHNGGYKTMVCNDFTQVISDGIGIWATNQGRVEAVSVFTYYAHLGYLSEDGGVIRGTNGNCSYGTFGVSAEGVDPSEISRISRVNNRKEEAQIISTFVDGEGIVHLEYSNAGQDYQPGNTTFTFEGNGVQGSIDVDQVVVQNGGVYEVRVMEAGKDWLAVVNNAQDGTANTIRLSASDVQVTNAYKGERVVIIDGQGVGQYGYVVAFNGGTKVATVAKESFTPLTVTATDAGSGRLTVSDTSSLSLNQAITFNGTDILGGLVEGTVYYVKEIPTLTQFTISSSAGGPVLSVTTESGSMTLHAAGFESYYAQPIETVLDTTTRYTIEPRVVFSTGTGATADGVISKGVDTISTSSNGGHYQVAPTVIISGTEEDSSGATATATITASVEAVRIREGGSGYTGIPNVQFVGGGLSNGSPNHAIGDANVTNKITSIAVTNGGTGYTNPPMVTISGAGYNNDGYISSRITKIVGEISVTNPGSNYTTVPTVTITGGGGSGAEAIANLNAVVTGFTVLEGGSGYSSIPGQTTVSIVPAAGDTTGAGATATAIIDNGVEGGPGVITGLQLGDAGSGYTKPPIVIITSTGVGTGAEVTANILGFIASVIVTKGGSDYISNPNVAFSSGNAAATAEITGSVSSLEIVSGGSGFTGPVTIGFQPVSDFIYNELKCSRDVGLIIEAVMADVIFGSNAQSTFAGISYLRSYSSTVLNDQKAETIAAINKTRDLVLAEVTDSTAYNRVSSYFSIITGIINSETAPSAVSLSYPDPSVVPQDTIYGSAVLRANRTFLQNEVAAWINDQILTAQPPFVSFTYNEATCKRDIGYLIDALAYDMLYGGNTLTKSAALSYWREDVSTTLAGNFVIGDTYRITTVGDTDFTLLGASSNTVGVVFVATGSGTLGETGKALGLTSYVAGQETQHQAAFTYLKSIVDDIITETDLSTVQVSDPVDNVQIILGTPGAAGNVTTVTGLIDIVIDVIVDGTTSTATVNPTFANGDVDVGVRTTVINTIPTIQTEVISWINGKYVGAGAVAIATTTGVVESVTITNPGTGYTSLPIVSITGGGGTGALGTVILNGSVSSITVTAPGKNYTTTPTVAFAGAHNFKSIVAGEAYYKNTSSLVAIGSTQLTETLAAMEYIKTLALAVATNTNPTTSYQSIISRSGTDIAPAGASDRTNFWIDVIKAIAENGRENNIAAGILTQNRPFIIAQAAAYTVNNDSVGDVYTEADLKKRVGLIVDAVAYDLTHGTVERTVSIGQQYGKLISNNSVLTLAILTFVNDLMQDIIVNTTVVPEVDGVTTWEGTWATGTAYDVNDVVFYSGATYIALTAHTSTQFVTDLSADKWEVYSLGQVYAELSASEITASTAISNCVDLIKSIVSVNNTLGDVSNSTYASLLLDNKVWIQAEVIEYVKATYPDFTYNETLCARDVGLIVDAIAHDVENSQAAIPVASATTTNVLSDITVTAGGDGYGQGTTVSFSNLNTGTLPTATPIITNGVITGFNITNTGKGFTSAPTVTINADTGSGAYARAYVLGGAVQQIRIIHPGSGYNAPPYVKLVDPNNTVEGRWEVRVGDGVLDQPTFITRGTSYLAAATTVASPTGYADTFQVGEFIWVQNLTNIPTPGANIQFEGNDQFYKLVTIRSLTGNLGIIGGRSLITANRAFVQRQVIAYINETYPSLDYNEDLCFRDVGLILDAVVADIFGDTERGIEAGKSYYRSASSLASIVNPLINGTQGFATIDAINKIEDYLINIVQNIDIPRNQLFELQVKEPGITDGDAVIPAVQNTLDIIRNIIVNGSTIFAVQDLLLDNKPYVQAEVMAFINTTYPELVYNQELCARDVGLIVDAIAYDLFAGLGANGPSPKSGLSRSREAGLRYYSNASAQIAITTQKAETVAAIQQIATEALAVVNNTLPTIVYQSAVTPTTGLVSASVELETIIQDGINEIVNIINNGVGVLPTGTYAARLQVSPPFTVDNVPVHDASVTIRSKYSQVRLTNHDFLNVGTGNKNETNYPGVPVNAPEPENEVLEAGGGRCFYTSTDQDGNFRVGELFAVEQATGIATLNADAFNLSGLNELTLGGINIGGTGATITEFSTDSLFFANSDSIVPTQKAIKTYIASQLGSGGGNLAVNAITAGDVQVTGNEISTNFPDGLQITVPEGVYVNQIVESTSTTTGSLVVAGGVGIAKDVNIGEDVNVGGDLVVTGNLTVNGTQTTLNVGTLSVEDTNITIAKDAADAAAANGAGITVNGPVEPATIIYASADDSWNLNKIVKADSIQGTPIGSTTKSTGGFTTLTADNAVTFTQGTSSTGSSTGTVVVTGGVGVSENLNVGGNIGTVGFTATGNVTMNPNGSSVQINPSGTGGVVISPTGSGGLTVAPTAVGTIDNVNIGETTRGSAKFTTVETNGKLLVTDATAATSTDSGALQVDGGAGINGALYAGSIQNTPIGSTTANTGRFTTGEFTSTTASTSSSTGAVTIAGGLGVAGALWAGSINVNGGGIDNTPIGATTANTGAFTTLTANNSVTFTKNTGSTSSTTGTLVVTGGVGISENLNVGGAVTITGNLTVNGTTTTINTTDLSVDDINITLGDTASPSDTTANGGGITLRGTSNKTMTWVQSTGYWTFNQPIQASSVQNTPIGSSTANTGAFTSLTANGAVTFTQNTASTSTSTGTLVVTGGLGVSGRINATDFTGTIGANTRSAGNFTTLDANSTVGLSPANANVTLSPSGTGTVTLNPATAGTINNMSIGATTAASGKFTSLTVTSTFSMTDTTDSSTTGTGAFVVAGGVGIAKNLNVGGTFKAVSKSFLIDHPTREGYKLQYGSLEGPEYGVYVRGKISGSNVIELPDYWTGLVDEATITVNLTAFGSYQQLFVEKIEGNKVYVSGGDNFFYTVYAERKDISKLTVEYKA